MRKLEDRLRSLTVADVMSRDLVLLSANQTIASAATTLAKREISGAPVVDEHGRFVGIISASDFVFRNADCGQGDASPCLSGRAELNVSASSSGSLSLESFGEETVRDLMSKGIQTVAADAPLLQAARMMCLGHVHRLPVVDPSGSVVGMVTSLDLVSALVGAFEEQLTN